MSLALIANVTNGTTPTSGEVSASAETAASPALAEVASSVFANVLRVIQRTLDGAAPDPAAEGGAGEGDTTADDADTTTCIGVDAAAAMLPGMAMTMVPAALQAAGISLAATAQRDASTATRDASVAPLASATAVAAALPASSTGTPRVERPLAALPEAVSSPAALARSAVSEIAPADASAPSPVPRGAVDTAAVRAPVERQPQPVATDASAASAMVPAIPADRDASTSDAVLKLNAASPSQWRQPLHDALGDRLQLQLGRGSDHALIRLDPPALGRIEIIVRHENGNVQVHLSASNPEVMRQLGHIGDSLRQDLVARQYGDVSVTVSDTGRDAAGRERSRDRPPADDQTPHRALTEANEIGTTATPFTLAHARD